MDALRFYKNEYTYIRRLFQSVGAEPDNYAPYIRITLRDRIVLNRKDTSQSKMEDIIELGANEFRVRISNSGELDFRENIN